MADQGGGEEEKKDDEPKKGCCDKYAECIMFTGKVFLILFIIVNSGYIR
jgi:hypothetical protein